jgi:hypothetical protein
MAYQAYKDDGTTLGSSRATFGASLDDVINAVGTTSPGFASIYPEVANVRTIVTFVNGGRYFIVGPTNPL